MQPIMSNDETDVEKQPFPDLGTVFCAKKKGIFLHDLFLYVATSSVNILMEMSEER